MTDKNTDQSELRIIAQLDAQTDRADALAIIAIILFILWVATAGMAIYMVAAR